MNTGMGLVVLALMLLANSPVLDFRKISLNSQLARVDSGEIALEEFDFYYAHSHLMRPGYLAMEQMKADIGDSDPALLEKIENPRPTRTALGLQNIGSFWERMTYRPTKFEVPPDLRVKIEHDPIATYGGETIMVQIDLDDDGQNEYALIRLLQNRVIPHAVYFYKTEDGWERGSFATPFPMDSDTDSEQSLKDGEIKVQEQRFKELHLGDIVLRPN